MTANGLMQSCGADARGKREQLIQCVNLYMVVMRRAGRRRRAAISDETEGIGSLPSARRRTQMAAAGDARRQPSHAGRNVEDQPVRERRRAGSIGINHFDQDGSRGSGNGSPRQRR